jgi:hypothetical protein
MDEEHYADWEWQPLDRMPDGCSKVSIKNATGDVDDMCSCDYWWKSDDDKAGFTSFRYT